MLKIRDQENVLMQFTSVWCILDQINNVSMNWPKTMAPLRISNNGKILSEVKKVNMRQRKPSVLNFSEIEQCTNTGFIVSGLTISPPPCSYVTICCVLDLSFWHMPQSHRIVLVTLHCFLFLAFDVCELCLIEIQIWFLIWFRHAKATSGKILLIILKLARTGSWKWAEEFLALMYLYKNLKILNIKSR